MAGFPADADDGLINAAAERKRQALLKEFGLNAELEEARDPAPAIRVLVVLGCVALVAISLMSPAITYVRPGMPDGVLPTWGLLVAGWVFVPALFSGELWAVGWLANVTLVGVIIELTVHQEKWATLTAAVGVVFAGLALLIDSVPLNNNGPPFPVASFEIGFFLWEAAMLLGFVGSVLLWWLDVAAQGPPVLEEARDWQEGLPWNVE